MKIFVRYMTKIMLGIFNKIKNREAIDVASKRAVIHPLSGLRVNEGGFSTASLIKV